MIAQAFIRGALLITVAALLATVLRNRSAALRHHIWATAVVAQLALLAFIPVLPTIYLPVVPTISARFDAPLVPHQEAERTPRASDRAVAPAAAPTAAHSATLKLPVPQSQSRQINWLLAIWATGATLIALRFLVGTLLMMRVAYEGRRIEDGAWLSLTQRIARELGISRPVTMIWGDRVAVPVTWGVLYPMILLPEAARDWPDERRRLVLVHELAHVKRFDALTQLFAQIATAVFWFSPFVWLAERRMRIEREHACDDTVIRYGTEPTRYADELLQMVRSLVRRRAQQPAFAALAMARKSAFEGRMIAILDPDRPRRVTGISSGFAFALLSILIAAPLAAVDPFAVRVTTQTALQSRSHENKSTPPAAAGSQCQFDRETVGTQAFVGDNPRKIDIKLQRATRCVFADITGPVSISTDERRIIEVEPTGFARVREVTPDQDVELVIDRKNGAIKRVFTINGAAPPDDGGTERAWLARVLPEVLSEGAIDPEQRVMRLLKSNGLAATLDQIGSLQSPAARLAHFKALVAVNEWNAAELERIKATAARYLTRTSDLAAFNRSMAKKKEPVARKGSNDDIEMMEQVLRGFTSSYDLHMAMKSQLTGASREMLLMFARVSAQISDSNEKGTFLIAAVPHFLGRDSQLRNAWFAAASNVQSSYERRLVLEAVLNNAKGSEVLTAAILKATTGMSPGYDKTVVLTEVAKRGLITTTALRTAFLAEVNTITSTTDRRTIIEALRL